MTPPTPLRRQRSMLGRSLQRALMVWVSVLVVYCIGHLVFLGTSPVALLDPVILYGCGGLALAAMLYTVHREVVHGMIARLRSDLEARTQACDLSALPMTETEELDPLIESINELFKMAQQRVQMTSALTSAARTQVEESNRDKLTGLYNRGYLNTHLGDEVSRTKVLSDELSVIMADVDHFKHYNDTNGHQRGDEVLRMVATILQQSTRALDVCIRYGGEEFLVVLPRTSHERARNTAERIRKAIEQHRFPAGETQPGGRLTISVGVASLPRHAKSEQGLIRKADEALYAAKQAGRNRVMSADDVTEPLLGPTFGPR